MWNYQTIKEKFHNLAQDADNNVRKDKLKASKAPPVYEGLHDISLARRDIYMHLATSHFTSKQDFVDALNELINNPTKNDNAFDEDRYNEARDSNLQRLIDEYQ